MRSCARVQPVVIIPGIELLSYTLSITYTTAAMIRPSFNSLGMGSTFQFRSVYLHAFIGPMQERELGEIRKPASCRVSHPFR